VPYAWDSLRRRPGRSALTALGVGLAVGLVVLLLALSAGVQTSASSLAGASGVDLLVASANTSFYQNTFPPVPQAHSLAVRIPAADPNVATASPWLVSDLVFGNASLWAAANRTSVPAGWGPTGSGSVGWIPDENAGIETPEVYNGSGFTAPADPHYANGSFQGPRTAEVELDQGLAGVLGVSVGGTVWAAATPPTGPAGLG
jgi:putative ABC transport system permease protein